MKIERNNYLNKIIERKQNGMIKVITGVRRCGKSYLLFELYYEYLISQGIVDSKIIKISLDNNTFAKQRNPNELAKKAKGVPLRSDYGYGVACRI